MALCLAFVLSLEHLIDNRGRVAVAAAVVVTWAAFLFRYSGLALVGVGVLVVLAPAGPRRAPRRVIDAMNLGLGAMLVPALWMARNRGVDDTLMGNRPPSTDALLPTVKGAFETIGEWILPIATNDARECAVGLLAGLAVAGVLIVVWRSHRDSRASSDRSVVPLVAVAVAVVVGYVGYLVAAQMTTAIERLGTRYLSPILALCTILLVIAADRAPALVGERFRPTARVAAPMFLAVLFVWHVPEIARSAIVGVRQVGLCRGRVAGFGARRCREVSPRVC